MKRWLFRFGAIFLGLLAGFLVLEVGYRFYLFGPVLHYKDCRVVDPSLFSNDRIQIFFVGDSFTAGYPHSVDHSFPVLLGRQWKNPAFQITNFSRRGANLHDQVRIIEQVMRLKPALVVWGISSNDIYSSRGQEWDPSSLRAASSFLFPEEKSHFNPLRHAFVELPYDCLFVARMSPFSTLKEVLQTYSYVYIQLKLRLRDHSGLQFLKAQGEDLSLRELDAESAAAYGKEADLTFLLEAIRYVQEELSKEGTPLAILYVPQEYDLNPGMFEGHLKRLGRDPAGFDRKTPRRLIAEFCKQQDLLFLDPCDRLEKILQEGKQLFITSDRHYNHIGNAQMAAFLNEESHRLSGLAQRKGSGQAS